MEAILVTPRSEAAASSLKSFLARMEGGFHTRAVRAPKKAETLEARITRLCAEGHYEDWEVEWFFSIPKEHRVDPFEVIEDGDVYWADRRNVEGMRRDMERATEAMCAGELATLAPGDSIGDFMQRIMADEGV